ncbi:topless-related protein 3-like [Trifolium pratense]|uniref:Topless-related protein 3-like n=1 Tax=Trifolium pratense TaxID=57577 RepID=A0A2K3NUD1_TRIPR|nr:topless-related protein 3-like [Trifolium pratense]
MIWASMLQIRRLGYFGDFNFIILFVVGILPLYAINSDAIVVKGIGYPAGNIPAVFTLNDKTRAVEILVNDLKIFSTYDQAIYKQLTHLLTLDNLRENIHLSQYQDVRSARDLLMTELKRLNWQHALCKYPKQSPNVMTILTDHSCDQPPNDANHPSRVDAPFLSAPVAPKANALPAWMVNGNPSSSSRPLAALTASALPGPSNLARSMESRRNSNDVSTARKLKEIVHHTQCRRVTMPESIGPSNKVCLLYTKPGTGLLALGSKGVLKMWKWSVTPSNPAGKATTSANPEHSTPAEGIFMTNDVQNNNDVIPCLDISKNDAYGLAACGETVSLCNMASSYKVFYQFTSPPPAATCIAFIPQDNNIAAIGREDSVIHIYSIRHDEVPPSLEEVASAPVNLCPMWPIKGDLICWFNPLSWTYPLRGGCLSPIGPFADKTWWAQLGQGTRLLIVELKGHQKLITGIAFSLRQNIMVSAGADAQLISWNMNTWSMNKAASIQLRTGEYAAPSETRVQFHSDQVMLLACHETQLALYDASRMKLMCQWLPHGGLQACAISSATYSSNFEQIYATFTDGNIGIFDAGSLIPRCRIAPSAYLYQTPSTSQNLFPLVVASNPGVPNQFAIALSDGTINVIEPKESEPWW